MTVLTDESDRLTSHFSHFRVQLSDKDRQETEIKTNFQISKTQTLQMSLSAVCIDGAVDKIIEL